jgi:hypothetical protein
MKEMENKERVKKLIEAAEREGFKITREDGFNYITAANGNFIEFDDDLNGSYRWMTDGQTIALPGSIDERAKYVIEVIERGLD